MIREYSLKEVAFELNLKQTARFKLQTKERKVFCAEGIVQANAWKGKKVEGIFG